MPLAEVINHSINDTGCHRTSLTSGNNASWLCWALYILGGSGLRGFSSFAIWIWGGDRPGQYSYHLRRQPALLVLSLGAGRVF